MIEKAKELIYKSKYLLAFTGAGISVESGIPPFRGKNGIWNKYDTKIFDIDYFHSNTKEAWQQIKYIFYEQLENIKPNNAHLALSKLEKMNILKFIITQNIDNLHTLAGNKNVIEFHGNTRNVICLNCDYSGKYQDIKEEEIPQCPKCGSYLKPDFVFFGEAIPIIEYKKAFACANLTDVILVIGTTGVVYPAQTIVREAKNNNATVIEINTNPSEYTDTVTDIYLEGKATEIMEQLVSV